MFTQIVAFIRKFRRAEEGAVVAYMAVLMVALLGMAGLAVDVGSAYFYRQQMQTAADAAAISGELALIKTQNVNREGQAVAKSFNGSGISGATVTINCNNTAAFTNCAGTVTAPGYTDTAAFPNAVEAIITKPQTVYFGKMVGGSDFSLFARAVANVPKINDCILALDTTGKAMTLKGNITIGNPDCGIADNSASDPSTDFKGASASINGYFTTNGPMNNNGNNVSFNEGSMEGVAVTDPYIANGENAWVTGRTKDPKLATGLAALSSATFPPANPKNCTSISGGTYTGPAAKPYCTVSGGAMLTSTTGSFTIGTLGSGTTLNGTAAYPNYINTVSSGATLGSSGTYYIDTLSTGMTLGAGTYFINNPPSGTTLGGGTYYIPSLPAGVTLSGTGTYYIGTVSAGVTLSGSGTYYIGTMSGGTLSGSSAAYYIGTLSGGTLQDNVYYINNLTGSVTTSNATLVVFDGADIGNLSLSLGAPVTNIGTNVNAGLALVSPNAITIGFGGNGTLVGAVYAPAVGATVYMRGTVNASCAQVIAGIVNIAGNVSLGSDSSCGITNIIQNGVKAQLVQ